MKCLKEYSKYVILNVLGMVGLSCYILADTYFIAKGLGSRGLAALNLAIPVYSLINGCGLMLGIGGATRYSIAQSQGNPHQNDCIFSHTLFAGICFALVFVLTGIFGTDPVTRLMGADKTVFSMCSTYIQILFLFSPMFLLNNILLCFVRNDGAPHLAMAAMLGGSFSNILLDYLFIFVFRMGIFGAVFATSLAPIISMMILSPFFLKKKHHFHITKCPFIPRIAGQIFAGGIPSLIAELSSGIVIMIFNGIILGMEGNTGVAAYGVVANLSLVIISIYSGIAQGIQPLVSKYYGAGNHKNTHLIFRYAVITIVILSVLIYLGVFFHADGITRIFNSECDQQLQEIAVRGIRLYFTGCLFAGFNIVLSIYDTSTDQTKPAGIISILRGFALIIPMAFLLSYFGKMTGLWMAFPVTELVVSIIGVAFCVHVWHSHRHS